MNIKIIGLGGIGSILSDQICRFANYSINDFKVKITLIDGDEYEHKNNERQTFNSFGSKADVKQYELSSKFSKLTISSIPNYIDSNNISTILSDGDLILMGVDNHKTRKIVSDYCTTLDSVTLISGGNDYTDGNVQIYHRREGKDLTPDLCAYHPEIDNPRDKLPTEMSCEELSKSEPQLLFTNLTAATLMCQAFYNVGIRDEVKYCESYFDILTMKADSKIRKVKN
jgi:molybdopterin/thiamine biosynthesis adenylyltransferase